MRFPILFIDHATALGGAERSLLLLIETLDRSLFLPHLATPPGALADAARAAGAVVHEVPLERLRGRVAAPWCLVRGAWRLAGAARRNQIALVYSNTVRASAYGGAVARWARRPHVWHVRDILRPGPSLRGLCALADALICVSAAAAAQLPCPRKVRVIPNGVRLGAPRGTRSADAVRLRTAWRVPADAVLVGHVARLAPWKGQIDVIDAAEMLVREYPDAYVAIVGGDVFGAYPGYEATLRAAVATRGLGHRVVLAGHAEDMPAVLEAVDVLVHASAAEPFGRAVIEAGAAGVPVVAYGGGGVPEIVVDGATGLLVPPGDRRALAGALVRLAGDEALRRRLGENGRVHVAAHFDVEPLTRLIEAVLRDLLAQREPSA